MRCYCYMRISSTIFWQTWITILGVQISLFISYNYYQEYSNVLQLQTCKYWPVMECLPDNLGSRRGTTQQRRLQIAGKQVNSVEWAHYWKGQLHGERRLIFWCKDRKIMSLAVSVAASIKFNDMVQYTSVIYAASMRSSKLDVADREKGPLRAKRDILAFFKLSPFQGLKSPGLLIWFLSSLFGPSTPQIQR